MSEFRFISEVRAALKSVQDESRLTIPIGDDAAEVRVGGGKVLFATDLLLDGTHFNLAECGGELAGRKALAVNLSDMAAMAAKPIAAVVSLALPIAGGSQSTEIGRAVMRGIGALAAEYGVAIAGGDTTSWRQAAPFAVNVAIIGEAHRCGSVTRAGAREGDAIFVTGPLGGSIFGRHLQFTPRVALAERLHSAYQIHSMIDLSDGLAGDLRHILRASGTGAILDREKIPVHADVQNYPGIDPSAALAHALSDGEDFELCFTLPANRAAKMQHDFACAPDAPVRIGTVVAAASRSAAEFMLRWANGDEITAKGYEHGWG